jgi:catechol 2,3-dioxygenase-like lactoylglutathione lyase family enzyme
VWPIGAVRPYARSVISGLAHTAVCVPDVDVATAWYSDVLGFSVLSPPFQMEGPSIERDMGELVPAPVVVKASIVGLAADDRVIELIEYPEAGVTGNADPVVTRHGITHIGLLCDDVAATRADLERRGVTFLTSGVADVARLRTTWFCDPWGTVFILLEKKDNNRPYWGQFNPPG